jgi:hypothetical protein
MQMVDWTMGGAWRELRLVGDALYVGTPFELFAKLSSNGGATQDR